MIEAKLREEQENAQSFNETNAQEKNQLLSKIAELETQINLAKQSNGRSKGPETKKGEASKETTKEEEKKGFQQYFNDSIPVQRGMYGSSMVSESY